MATPSSKEENGTFYDIFLKKLMLFKILNGHRNLLININNACVELCGGKNLKSNEQTCCCKCRSKEIKILSNLSDSQAENNNAATTKDETHLLNVCRNYIKAFFY